MRDPVGKRGASSGKKKRKSMKKARYWIGTRPEKKSDTRSSEEKTRGALGRGGGGRVVGSVSE